MDYVTKGLYPEKVFRNFENISQIPRSSGKEKQVSDYIVNFAKDLGLDTYQDEYNNIVIRKPATNGNPDGPTVMLQAHIDMVTESGDFSNHDFDKDPIELIIDGNHLHANDTTLGADNGIGVAYMMSVLESQDIKHPNLECVFTSDEEVGLIGVNRLDFSNLKSSLVINLDSEEDYNILVGCAGAVDSILSIRKEYKPATPTNVALEITIRGLFGGHSGMDIDKNRGNANQIMGRLLNSISVDFDIFNIDGGSKRNAIPRTSETVISVSDKDIEQAAKDIQKMSAKIQKELYATEPNLKISLRRSASMDFKVFTDACKDKIIKTLMLMPAGVIAMEAELDEQVETSTNFALVKETDTHIEFKNLTRSSSQSKKEYVKSKIEALADLLGAEIEFSAGYPAWEYNSNSQLENKAVDIYKDVFKKAPNVLVMHCGLECGILISKLPQKAEAISIGPTMYDVHTPKEYVEIDSVGKIWDYLLTLLERI